MTHPTETDRELLELAAKALNGGAWHPLTHAPQHGKDWNPITDDGDALRLAVKLRLNIQHYARSTGVMCVQAVIDWGLCNDAFHEEHGSDPYAATRRAIVRAAAEIGRAMR